MADAAPTPDTDAAEEPAALNPADNIGAMPIDALPRTVPTEGTFLGVVGLVTDHVQEYRADEAERAEAEAKAERAHALARTSAQLGEDIGDGFLAMLDEAGLTPVYYPNDSDPESAGFAFNVGQDSRTVSVKVTENPEVPRRYDLRIIYFGTDDRPHVVTSTNIPPGDTLRAAVCLGYARASDVSRALGREHDQIQAMNAESERMEAERQKAREDGHAEALAIIEAAAAEADDKLWSWPVHANGEPFRFKLYNVTLVSEGSESSYTGVVGEVAESNDGTLSFGVLTRDGSGTYEVRSSAYSYVQEEDPYTDVESLPRGLRQTLYTNAEGVYYFDSGWGKPQREPVLSLDPEATMQVAVRDLPVPALRELIDMAALKDGIESRSVWHGWKPDASKLTATRKEGGDLWPPYPEFVIGEHLKEDPRF